MSNNFVEWILARMKEQSTWIGLISLISALGITLSPSQVQAIVTLGVSLSSAILIFMPDSGSKK